MHKSWDNVQAAKIYKERISKMIGDDEYGKKWLQMMKEKYGDDYVAFMGSSSSDGPFDNIYAPGKQGFFNIELFPGLDPSERIIPLVSTQTDGRAKVHNLIENILKLPSYPKNWQLELNLMIPFILWRYPNIPDFGNRIGQWGIVVTCESGSVDGADGYGYPYSHAKTIIDANGTITTYGSNNSNPVTMTWDKTNSGYDPAPIGAVGAYIGYEPFKRIAIRENGGRLFLRFGGPAKPFFEVPAFAGISSLTVYRGISMFYCADVSTIPANQREMGWSLTDV